VIISAIPTPRIEIPIAPIVSPFMRPLFRSSALA
jgi:hypothetical protein